MSQKCCIHLALQRQLLKTQPALFPQSTHFLVDSCSKFTALYLRIFYEQYLHMYNESLFYFL